LVHQTAIHRGSGKNRLQTVDDEDKRHAESLLKQVKRILIEKPFQSKREIEMSQIGASGLWRRSTPQPLAQKRIGASNL
jgi:hypothetical protein